MQVLLTEKTRQEKLQKGLIEKRNLFGLGFTSLIAACGDKTAGDGGNDNSEGPGDPATLPFKAEKAEKLEEATDSGFTATLGGDTSSLTVEVSDDSAAATLNFPNGGAGGANAGIYKLTTTENKYDLVISSPIFDKDQNNGAEYAKGRIFIYWDVAEVANSQPPENSPHLEIKGAFQSDRIGIYPPDFFQLGSADNGGYDMVIRVAYAGGGRGAIYVLWDVANYIGSNTIDLGKLGMSNENATAGSLEIQGKALIDYIGTHAPDFLQIGGATDGGYDMVIRSHKVGNDKGAIYILWDINDYYQDENGAKLNKKIDLGADAGDTNGHYATAGLLTIYGAKASDQIGTYAPEFLQLGGTDNKYDMVIRSPNVDKVVSGENTFEGGIYILWDIVDYDEETKTIDLNPTALGNANTGATSGSLAIYGAIIGDSIGIHAPKFLQIGGEIDSYDMVIRSYRVDSPTGSDHPQDNEGATYILWDVADYTDSNSSIDLHKDNISNGATFGSLAIYGAGKYDHIGSHAPDFLQIGGEIDNYDMVIRSHEVDKAGSSSNNFTDNQGAIYILWDVEDYTGGNKTINLTSLSGGATSGLLTIYGATKANLGNDVNNILYGDDDDGNNILTNIDKDTVGGAAGTKDIAFRDKDYTYILFGDKVAEVDGGTGKVTSKTIDLAVVETALTAGMAGFFGYDFGNGNVDKVGYRFADRKADLDAVQTAYDTATSTTLSDTDADLAVWDIA